MAAVRDLSTEALAWTVHSLGLQPEQVAVGEEELASHQVYLESSHPEVPGALVDVTQATRPQLLIQRQGECVNSLAKAFEAGHRTSAEELAQARARNRGLS